jgi:4-hydroxy-3-polyprenylbenzoate decarboxylase
MTYRNLQSCVADLEQHGHLVRIEEPIDADLEAAEIHRRVFASGGPAILFANVVGCKFPMVSNLFGTMPRVRFIFRKTIEHVRRLIDMKMEPETFFKAPLQGAASGARAIHMMPKTVRSGPAISNQTQISKLPPLKSWPLDGGAFVTLPVVYTEDVEKPGLRGSNLGMYRIQLTGNDYLPDEEIGLHYQLHRGIGVHHTKALAADQPFRVNIFVGGAPAMSVAAVMPLPEGMSELGFAGALGGHRIPMIRRRQGLPIYAEADFCIAGTVIPHKLLPEGPFGDHLGYYSLAHDFPVLRVERVYCRDAAIWPFTVVGRPPQEDTMFGEIIHELTSAAIPATIPGIRSVHAVDAAGVHPLLLAIGSERYVPFQTVSQPQEILTQANAILGQGQLSLAKYLFIAAGNEHPELDTRDIPRFFQFVLERLDPSRDVHFHTCTTIDTLDYSGSSLNSGSKVVFAAAGPKLRELPHELPSTLDLPDGFSEPRIALPGVLVVQSAGGGSAAQFCQSANQHATFNRFPLVVLVDDSEFVGESLGNFLWVTFTRSNPAADIDGVQASIRDKHWGCQGSLVIDARVKPHHAPPLVPDPDVAQRVDAMAARGGPLAKWL